MGGSGSSSGNDFRLKSERTRCISSGKKTFSGELKLSIGREESRKVYTFMSGLGEGHRPVKIVIQKTLREGRHLS